MPAMPAFIRATAHDVRWRLLGELAGSDRQVHELTAQVGLPQNLVSYHLGQLRSAGLVTTRRSSADGRDVYYRLDLAHCAALLRDVGGALHPALRLDPPASPAASSPRRRVRVLFLCTGNSSRSQMAEALLRQRATWVTVKSAGSHPKPVHPDTIRAMAEHGIDLTGVRSKHLDRFIGERFDDVVSLCDRLREVCPDFPGPPRMAHWSIADPANDPDGYPAFQRVAAELVERIDFFIHTIAARAPREAS
jgi:ArsR family transcriptional regulator, arsenate/arsenite/antimonite-responsive transcriptional repressor / arsenate reductase (thioredoxin)